MKATQILAVALPLLMIIAAYRAYMYIHRPPAITCEAFQRYALSHVPDTVAHVRVVGTLEPGANYTITGDELALLKALSSEPGIQRLCVILLVADYKHIAYTVARESKYVDGDGAIYYESSTMRRDYYVLVRRQVVARFSLDKVPMNVTRIVLPGLRLPENPPGNSTIRVLYVWVTGLPHGACDTAIIDGMFRYVGDFLPGAREAVLKDNIYWVQSYEKHSPLYVVCHTSSAFYYALRVGQR